MPASASAAASNSLQPRVPARVAARDSNTLAPVREGGSPSRRITVASTTSSPLARRAAISSSRLGTGGGGGQRGGYDVARARDLFMGGRVPGGPPEAAERGLQAQSHRQQHVLALAFVERTGGEVGQARLRAGEPAAELVEQTAERICVSASHGGARVPLPHAHRDCGCEGDR